LTNSLAIAHAMQHHRARPSVYLSGGLLRPESGTLVGREAVTFFSRRRATKLLLSATGLDAEAGVSDPNPQEIEVKQAMASRAQEVILMADASKLGVVSLMQTLPWRRVDRLVTDAPRKDPRLQGILSPKRVCSA
jgi:DeoR/GlpR family transcriptional regulator of sugar metabolism